MPLYTALKHTGYKRARREKALNKSESLRNSENLYDLTALHSIRRCMFSPDALQFP